VYDVNTAELLDIDPVLADVLPLYGPLAAEEVEAALAERHTAAAVRAAVAEIERARAVEGLFRPDRPAVHEIVEDAEGYSLRHLVLEVTDRCNLRCRYCLHGAERDDTRPHGTRTMPVATALAALQFFAARCGDTAEPSVSFYGGEPLLALPVIRAVLAEARSHPDWPRLTFAIDTNATLLDAEVVELVVREGLRLQMSLDGPARLHDRHRQSAAGGGSHAAVEDAVTRLLARDPALASRFAFQATLAPPYDLPAVLAYFADFPPFRTAGVTDPPFVRLTVADLGGTGLDAPGDRDELRSQFAAAHEVYRRSCLAGEHETMSPALAALFDDALVRVRRRSRKPLPDCGLGGCCRPAEPRLHVAVDGNFRPCERIGRQSIIGDVVHGIDAGLVAALRGRFLAATGGRCADCWAVRFCTACFASLPPTGGAIPESVCTRIRARCEGSLMLYREILNGPASAWKWFENRQLI
jgi:uncharacterized protein